MRQDIPGAQVLFDSRIPFLQIPCDGVQAEAAWELWDVDTPEKMEQIRVAYGQMTDKEH